MHYDEINSTFVTFSARLPIIWLVSLPTPALFFPAPADAVLDDGGAVLVADAGLAQEAEVDGDCGVSHGGGVRVVEGGGVTGRLVQGSRGVCKEGQKLL